MPFHLLFDGVNVGQPPAANWSAPRALAFSYTPYGRQGIGVVQPQSGSDYPLIAVPSAGIRYLLADAWLSYDDPSDYYNIKPFQPPFHIAWLYGLGTAPSSKPANYPDPAHDVDIIVVDDNNCVVFDSTADDVVGSYWTREWTERLTIHGWEGEDALMFIVVHTTWGHTADPKLTPREYALHIAPARATLDERVVGRRPRRVKSLQVAFDNMTKKGVELHEGYNMAISHDGEALRGEGLRRTQLVTFDASPGGGLGVYPGCEEQETYVRKIAGVAPTAAGDFVFGGKGCYYARQPTALITVSPRRYTSADGLLETGNDCKPCCACEDYVDVAKYMNRIRDDYQALGEEFSGIRDQYHVNRERWLDAKCCFERFPLRVVVQPQICPNVDVGVQFCNLSDHCVGPVELFISVEVLTGGLAPIGELPEDCPLTRVVPGFTVARGQTYSTARRTSNEERYELLGSHPEYRAYWEFVEAKQSAWVRFRLNVGAYGVDANDDPLRVQVTVTGEVGDPLGFNPRPITVETCESLSSVQLASASASAFLRCPERADDTYNPHCPEYEEGCD